jgi:hypothetical protein
VRFGYKKGSQIVARQTPTSQHATPLDPSPAARTPLANPRRVVHRRDFLMLVGFNEPEFVDALKRCLPRHAYVHDPYGGIIAVKGDRERGVAHYILSELYPYADDYHKEHSRARVTWDSWLLDPAPGRRLSAEWAAFLGGFGRVAMRGRR